MGEIFNPSSDPVYGAAVKMNIYNNTQFLASAIVQMTFPATLSGELNPFAKGFPFIEGFPNWAEFEFISWRMTSSTAYANATILSIVPDLVWESITVTARNDHSYSL